MKEQLLVIFLIPDLLDYRREKGCMRLWDKCRNKYTLSLKKNKGTKRKGNILSYLLILFIEQTRF